MDQFFTSLSKRQTMMLLTAITFGGQEGVGALEHLPDEEAELLRHRAQEILQIPRDKRIPLMVSEIKRLVKDRRGQLWSADPEKLAALLKRERAALVEVVLRALPAPLADAVRTHLPAPGRVKLAREVRPQVLDIVRWKLEEQLSREASAHVPFKFTDVLLLQARELLTVCDRLGARVLGPALAGIPDGARDPVMATLPPHLRQLATRAVTANGPRKLPEEDARAQLDVYGGLDNLAVAIRAAGVHRLARATVAQSAEFASRLVEKHRGEFGQVLTKWVREERAKAPSRGDGGRTDIVTDLERLAARGLIDRPVRLAPPRPPALGPPPSAKGSAPAGRSQAPARTGTGAELSSARGRALSSQSVRRDPIAEREARRAGATSNLARPEEEDSRVSRGLSRTGREGSVIGARPTGRPRSDEATGEEEPREGSRIFRSSSRPRGGGESEGTSSERPPRVLGTNSSIPALKDGRGGSERPERSRTQDSAGRGPRGGSR